jgi:hypothetical protein
MAEATFKIRESRRESGQVFEIIAIAPSRRVLGIVELLIPIEPGYSLSERIGTAGQQELLDAATDLARRLADAVERPVTEPIQQ